MKSLQEVLKGIEAFKKDMEALGVRMSVSVDPMPVGASAEVAIHLKTLVRDDIKDLEAEA